MSKKQIILTIVIIICIIFTGCNTLNQKISSGTNQNVTESDGKQSHGLVRPDARDYMKHYGTVLQEIPIAKIFVCTEAQAYAELAEHGFGSYPITVSYDMSGNYLDSIDISPGETAKHPYYCTYYYSENNNIWWTITYVNGHYLAQALTDEGASGESRVYIYSDDTVMTLYDSKYNACFIVQPDPDIYVFKTVKEINSAVLESLPYEDVVDEKY